MVTNKVLVFYDFSRYVDYNIILDIKLTLAKA